MGPDKEVDFAADPDVTVDEIASWTAAVDAPGVPRRCGSRCRHLCLCAAPRSACSSRRCCVVGSLAPETGAERLLPEQRRDRIVACRAYSMCMCTARGHVCEHA